MIHAKTKDNIQGTWHHDSVPKCVNFSGTHSVQRKQKLRRTSRYKGHLGVRYIHTDRIVDENDNFRIIVHCCLRSIHVFLGNACYGGSRDFAPFRLVNFNCLFYYVDHNRCGCTKGQSSKIMLVLSLRCKKLFP